MRKPAFCIFLWPLYSDLIFFIDQYWRGVSNKHCLLPFFHFASDEGWGGGGQIPGLMHVVLYR